MNIRKAMLAFHMLSKLDEVQQTLELISEGAATIGLSIEDTKRLKTNADLMIQNLDVLIDPISDAMMNATEGN